MFLFHRLVSKHIGNNLNLYLYDVRKVLPSRQPVVCVFTEG